jgi:hypothetical protein
MKLAVLTGPRLWNQDIRGLNRGAGTDKFMDEVRRLRELAERCLRLARFVLDAQVAEGPKELAAGFEASATRLQVKLRGVRDRPF